MERGNGMDTLRPKGLPLLIGSLPLDNHKRALDLVFDYSNYIPLWVQLPKNRFEGMISQFMVGLPGYTLEGDKEFIDISSGSFHEELLRFYEEYMEILEGKLDIVDSSFGLDKKRCRGFYCLVKRLNDDPVIDKVYAIKGQITGPITFATAVKDMDGRAIFYDDQLRDVGIKHLAMQAYYQAEVLSRFNKPVIIFLDEPALAGFGSSEFISISKQDVISAFSEIISLLHEKGVYVGIHVCANTDWSLVFDSGADILSFDAYSYLNKLLLFKDHLKSFLQKNGLIAWGIVPTQKELIEKLSFDSLLSTFESQLKETMDVLDIDINTLLNQTFITPSCGTGSLSPQMAEKVLSYTKELYNYIKRAKLST